MIEVLKTQPTEGKNWLEQYWLVGAIALIVSAFLGLFATLSLKNSETNIEALTTLFDLEENIPVSKEAKKEASHYLVKNRDLMRQSVKFFLDDPVIVEQVTKKASVPFTQATRLIAQKRYKEALDASWKMQPELSTPILKSINLLRILALEEELKLLDHQKALKALEELKAAHPLETHQVLGYYQIGNINPETLFADGMVKAD